MRIVKIFLSVALVSMYIVTNAQVAGTVIPIESNDNALVLQTDKSNHLVISYFGEKLKNSEEYSKILSQRRMVEEGADRNHLAMSAAGTNLMSSPAIAVIHADGNNSLDLIYQAHNTNTSKDGSLTTIVTLKDAVYEFYVDLYYKVWKNENVFEQWSVIRNKEKGKVVLNKFASANLYFFHDKYFLTSYNGGWGREMQPEFTPLKQGIHSISSVLGTRENLLSSQNFMLHFDDKATETTGNVLLGQLAWNGNYNIEFQIDAYKNLKLIAGINADYQSVYHLDPQASFETPKFIYTLSNQGIGNASRNLQDWMRKYNLLDGEGQRLTLLNNWEATYFNFDEQKLISLFAGAKELGVNMFLLDDGWFGNKYPRNGDNAGLGDWQANIKKLPHGVENLVKEAEKVGVKFGIWIEPEMVNPKSELYEKHLDWVIRELNRPEIYFRNQLVLDLTNPEVQDFVFNVVDELFTKNPNLAFIKWDCNAPMYNAHSMYLEKKKIPQSHLYIDYTRGLEKVLKRIRAKYPTVPMMLCSGGGGRTDYNLLKYFTEFWPSDNTDPLDRIFMQWDYSYYYPSIAVCNHVTDWSKKPIKYRVDVASMGKLGFDIVVNELKENELAYCKRAIKNYDDYKNIVWHGDMYRLQSPYDFPYASLMYVDKNKSRAVMFNYLSDWRYSKPNHRPILLQGLDTKKNYKIKEINLYDNQQSSVTTDKIYSGDFLMNVGFNPDVNTGRSSVVLMIEEV